MLNEKTQYFDTSKKILNLIPKNGIIAEIGVLRGEFSSQINSLCSPKKLYLIDCWEEQDDEKYLLDTYNEGDEQTHEENYISVLNKFINKDNVKIIKAHSDFAIKLFDKNYFDMVYLDASKYHEDIMRDLDSWYPLIKYNGLLCCNNYENNEDKFSIQVNDAVNEFCIKNNLFITHMTFEKNSFFAILKPNLKLF
jgi:hypothetical protein